MRVFFWLLLAVMLNGCSSEDHTARDETVKNVAAPFAADSINVQLTAEPRLNVVNDMPNSCTVLLFQSKDKATLDAILGNPATLKSFFSGAGAEGGVLQVDRYPVMPGQTNTLHIDRAMNTRHVALVAGYYPFPGKQHIIRADIPVESHSTGWWKPQWHASLLPLTMAVTLGSESIVNATDNTTADAAGETK